MCCAPSRLSARSPIDNAAFVVQGGTITAVGRETYMQDLNRALYYGIGVVMSQGIDPGDFALQIRAEQAAGTLGGAQGGPDRDLG